MYKIIDVVIKITSKNNLQFSQVRSQSQYCSNVL